MNLEIRNKPRTGLIKSLFGLTALSVSSVAVADIPAPTGLTANVFGNDVQLTWDSYSTTNLPAECTHNQEIQLRRNGSEFATAGITEISYTDADLGNGAYTYEIRARCRIPGPPAVNLRSAWSTSAIAIVELATCVSAPSIFASVTPVMLWPPNGKMIPVTVTGSVTAGSGCQTPGQVSWELVDEYDEHSNFGSVEVTNGQFSLSLSLEASRLGYDMDGRVYTINLTASAEGYTSEVEFVEVLVPHDQRRR
jgi:hypothetical protein